MSVEFHGLPEAQVVAEVAAGTLDIGAVALERVPAQLQQLPLSTPPTGFTVITPRTHRLAARRGVPISALKDERVILLMDPALSERLTTAFAESAAVPAGVMRMPGIDSLKRAVAMGLGIGVVPGGVASTLGPQGDIAAVPLAFTPFTSSLTLIYGRHDSPSKVIAGFIDIVRTPGRPPLPTGDTSHVRRTAAHT
jgi:DNA-binding transcriptional LysR family regulator